MRRLPSLVISQEDFHQISALISIARTEVSELLEEELGRAKLIPTEQLSNEIVSMNSEVTFLDLDTGKEHQMTLVYPHEANMETGRISILAPVGAALIGLRVGQSIDWPIRDKKIRRLKIVSVSPPKRNEP